MFARGGSCCRRSSPFALGFTATTLILIVHGLVVLVLLVERVVHVFGLFGLLLSSAPLFRLAHFVQVAIFDGTQKLPLGKLENRKKVILLILEKAVYFTQFVTSSA
jgi:hypothetical protein